MTTVSDHRPTTYDDPRVVAPDHVVEVCDSRGALFGRHHLVDVADFDDRFAAVLRRLEDAPSAGLAIDHDGVRRSAAGAVLDSLIFHGSRTVLADFHAALDDGSLGAGRADGAPDHRRFHLFDEQLSGAAGRAELRRRHPGWAELADRIAATRLRLLEECCTRLVADLDVVTRVLGTRPSRLLEVTMSSGDSHAGGRSVVIVRTDAGRVVYKPRSLAADLVVDDVLRRLRAAVGDDAARIPRTADLATHGWQEYVAPRACRSGDEVVTYYRRLGSLLAVLRALGTTDIHFENLTASGPDPFVVDLETLLRRRSPGEGPGSTIDDAVGRRLGRSVLGTMILPMNYAGATFDIDLSAMGVVEEQTSDRFASWRIVGAGTDAMRYERAATPIRHDANLVRLGEGHVDHREHDDDVVAGFTASWAALCADPTVLESARRAARGVGRRVPVRQVLRPTAIYWRFLEASLHPSYLDDEDARRGLLERLGTNPQVPDHAAGEVLRHEVDALLHGDIPLFDNALDSVDLVANGAALVPDVYDEPLGTDLLANLDAVGPAAEAPERNMIRTALMTAAKHVWQGGVRRGDAGAAVFADPDPLAAARALGDELETLALRAGGPEAPRAGWVVARLHGERRLQIARNDFGLFEGGGILAALTALGRATGEERHVATARAALGVLLDDVEPWLAAGPVSAYTGTTSLLAVAARVAGTTPGTRELARAVDLPGALADVLSGARDEPDDLLLGLAGLVRLQLELTEHHPDLTRPVGDDLLERAYDRLLDSTGDGSGGMAHGRTGILMVLAELAGALGGSRPDAVRRLLSDPLHRLDPDAGPDLGADARASVSWCRGLTGATLATARGLRTLGLSGSAAAAELGPSLAALRRRGPVTGDLSLCHGTAGVVAALSELAVLLDDPELAVLARDEARRALAAAYRDGWTGGLLRSAGLTTGFLGTSGLVHALVQAHDPATPSLVGLDLAAALPAGDAS